MEKWSVPIAAAEAAVTGIILIVSPSLFGWLILGAEPDFLGQVLGRLAGIALLGMGLATWSPLSAGRHPHSSVRALSIYNLLATIYLVYLGLGGQVNGFLLWPAIAMHAAFSLLLARLHFKVRTKSE